MDVKFTCTGIYIILIFSTMYICVDDQQKIKQTRSFVAEVRKYKFYL